MYATFEPFSVQSWQSTVMLSGHPQIQGMTVVLVGAEMKPELVFVLGVIAAKALLPPLPALAITKPSVATFVVLSPTVCVVAVIPFTRAPERTDAAGSPVAFVSTKAEGVPRAGVTSVGLIANTAAPVPVSSVMTPAS